MKLSLSSLLNNCPCGDTILLILWLKKLVVRFKVVSLLKDIGIYTSLDFITVIPAQAGIQG